MNEPIYLTFYPPAPAPTSAVAQGGKVTGIYLNTYMPSGIINKTFTLLNIIFLNLRLMKIGNIIGLGALAFGLWFVLRKSSVAKNATFSFEKLDVDIKKLKILMTLGISNPTNTPIGLNSVVGALMLNGKQIASIESFDQTTIAPTAKTNVRLTLRPSAIGVFQTIKDVWKTKLQGAKINAEFVGSANVDGITFPIKSTLA